MSKINPYLSDFGAIFVIVMVLGVGATQALAERWLASHGYKLSPVLVSMVVGLVTVMMFLLARAAFIRIALRKPETQDDEKEANAAEQDRGRYGS